MVLTIFMFAVCIMTAVGLTVFFRKQKAAKKKIMENQSAEQITEQMIYEPVPQPQTEEHSLTLEERIELSWQFLINIKEQVLSRFSAADREKVEELGQKLIENGMRYEHDVAGELMVKQELAKSIAQGAGKNKNSGSTSGKSM